MTPKDHFTSRWGADGVLIEADWASLEIVGWGLLTQDPKLLQLLNTGQDMHRHVGSMVLNKPMDEITKEERTKLKPANFTLIYGGTAYNLVSKDGLEPDFAQQVYDTFWSIFPVAKLWGDNQMAILDANAIQINELSPNGSPRLESWYQGPTGRVFYFKSYPDKVSDFTFKNRIYSKKGFKFSEGLNYQVQSLCTADIHMIALGNLFREAIRNRDKFVLINTVHDSALIDCKKQHIDLTCQVIKESLESVTGIMQTKFGLNVNVPLSVELKYGDSWSSCVKWNG